MNRPKYEVGQKIWTVGDREIKERKITGLFKYSDRKEYYYSIKMSDYMYSPSINIPESKIYPDKESFIKSL